MKLAVVGTGMIVKEFLPYLLTIKGITCDALCGTMRSSSLVQDLCKTYKIAHAYTDYEELLASDIDIVYLAVPNHLHFDFCKKALEAGKHVIMEKPFTSNYNEALPLASLAKERNLFCYEAISTKYLNNYKKIKEWILEIGDIRLVECNFSQYSSRYQAFLDGELPPVFDPTKSGGTLVDLNSYNIQYVTGLFGKPSSIHYYANINRGIDTSGVLTMQYSSFHAVCVAAKDSSSPSRYVIQGTKGYILQTTPANSCGEVSLHLNDGTVVCFDHNECEHRMIPEFETFIQMIAENNIRHCYHMLDESLIVSKILTEARIGAGILYPADMI